jgi:hypothetical protein
MSPFLPRRVGLQRQLGQDRRGRRRIGHQPPQSHQEIVRQRVHHHPKGVGHVPVVAQPVSLELTLELFVAILALAPVGVLVVTALRHDPRAGPIRHHGAAIRARDMGFAFDDCPPRLVPRFGLVVEGREQPLGLMCRFPRGNRGVQRGT